ncbi:MAG: class I SAM-dependent methyltransferase [Candidatus Accumulibacter sp.]|jgi:SAM-dependent methyltransferase|nr:class I SAM-dependent methyltransferase [Accumulibacter sp.]
MSIPKIGKWLETPRGRYIAEWEQSKIEVMIADLFGYNALQLGYSECPFLAKSRIPLRRTVGEHEGVDVRCDLRELPFASACIDLVVMPHVLEFHENPHQILREVERVLIPEGQVLITGFNPISLWGLRRRFSPAARDFPEDGNYISVLRLRDWLQLLSFEVDRGNFGCYAPPCRQEAWLKRWRFMEAAGDRWWSFAGGVYVLRAIKKVRGLRLLLPKWNEEKASSKALGAATRKESEQRVQ